MKGIQYEELRIAILPSLLDISLIDLGRGLSDGRIVIALPLPQHHGSEDRHGANGDQLLRTPSVHKLR